MDYYHTELRITLNALKKHFPNTLTLLCKAGTKENAYLFVEIFLFTNNRESKLLYKLNYPVIFMKFYHEIKYVQLSAPFLRHGFESSCSISALGSNFLAMVVIIP